MPCHIRRNCCKDRLSNHHLKLRFFVPEPLASVWLLEGSLSVLLAVPEPPFSDDFASLLGDENKMSWSVGSAKQLSPVSSNLRHLASVRLMNASATCLVTLWTFNALFPRDACFQSNIHKGTPYIYYPTSHQNLIMIQCKYSLTYYHSFLVSYFHKLVHSKLLNFPAWKPETLAKVIV